MIAFGVLAGAAIPIVPTFVIPGNPLSHFVTWHVVIRSALDLLMRGESALELIELPLGGQNDLRGNPRETWWPGRIIWEAGGAKVVPLKWQSSGDLTGLAGVNALIRIPSNSMRISAGFAVKALPLV